MGTVLCLAAVKGKNHEKNLQHFMMIGDSAQVDIHSLLQPIVDADDTDSIKNPDTPKQKAPPFSPFHRTEIDAILSLKEEKKELLAELEAFKSERRILQQKVKMLEEENNKLKEQVGMLTQKMAEEKSNQKKQNQGLKEKYHETLGNTITLQRDLDAKVVVIEELEKQLESLKQEHSKQVKNLQDELQMAESQLVAARCEGSKHSVLKKSYEKLKEEIKALRKENLQLRDYHIALAQRGNNNDQQEADKMSQVCKELRVKVKDLQSKAQVRDVDMKRLQFQNEHLKTQNKQNLEKYQRIKREYDMVMQQVQNKNNSIVSNLSSRLSSPHHQPYLLSPGYHFTDGLPFRPESEMSQHSSKTQSSNIMMFRASAPLQTCQKPVMESETDEEKGFKSPQFIQLSESFISRGKASEKRTQSRNKSDVVKSPTFSKEELQLKMSGAQPPKYESELESLVFQEGFHGDCEVTQNQSELALSPIAATGKQKQLKLIQLEQKIGELQHQKQVCRQHNFILNRKIQELEADNLRLSTEQDLVETGSKDTERRASSRCIDTEVRRVEEERDRALEKLAIWEKKIRHFEEVKRKNKKLQSEKELRFKEISHLYQQRAQLQDRLVQSKETSLKQQQEIQNLKEKIFMMERTQQAQHFTSFSQNSNSKLIHHSGVTNQAHSFERSRENQSPPSFLQNSKQFFGPHSSADWALSQNQSDKMQEATTGVTTPSGTGNVDKMLLEQIQLLKAQLEKKNEQLRLKERESITAEEDNIKHIEILKQFHQQEIAHFRSVLSQKNKQIQIYKLYVNHEFPPTAAQHSSGNESGSNSFLGSPEQNAKGVNPASSSEHLMSVFYELEQQRQKLKDLQAEREAANINFMIPINLQDYSPHTVPSLHSSFSKNQAPRRDSYNNSAASSSSKLSGQLNTSIGPHSGQISARTNLVSRGSVSKEYPHQSARGHGSGFWNHPFLKSSGSSHSEREESLIL